MDRKKTSKDGCTRRDIDGLTAEGGARDGDGAVVLASDAVAKYDTSMHAFISTAVDFLALKTQHTHSQSQDLAARRAFNSQQKVRSASKDRGAHPCGAEPKHSCIALVKDKVEAVRAGIPQRFSTATACQ